MAKIEQNTTMAGDLTAFFDPFLDYGGYKDRFLVARLDMEERLKAGSTILPPLRSVDDVTTPAGT